MGARTPGGHDQPPVSSPFFHQVPSFHVRSQTAVPSDSRAMRGFGVADLEAAGKVDRGRNAGDPGAWAA